MLLDTGNGWKVLVSKRVRFNKEQRSNIGALEGALRKALLKCCDKILQQKELQHS